MARALVATGLDADARVRARAARRARSRASAARSSLDLDRLGELAAERARRGARPRARCAGCGGSTRSSELDVPVILLVGGATGTGKSTVATEAAHRLGITRVTSTDFIRQTMRAFFSKEFMPSVHYSSFEAGSR